MDHKHAEIASVRLDVFWLLKHFRRAITMLIFCHSFAIRPPSWIEGARLELNS